MDWLYSLSLMLHSIMHHPVMARLRQPRHQDCAKLVLRLALGAVFMYHGWLKLNGLEGTGMFFGKIGIPAPEAMAVLVACVEFFGGALVLLGLATRAWALGLATVMVVAILSAKGLSSWAKIEFEVSLLAMALSLFFSGAGAYSIDAMLMKKGQGQHDAAMPAKQA